MEKSYASGTPKACLRRPCSTRSIISKGSSTSIGWTHWTSSSAPSRCANGKRMSAKRGARLGSKKTTSPQPKPHRTNADARPCRVDLRVPFSRQLTPESGPLTLYETSDLHRRPDRAGHLRRLATAAGQLHSGRGRPPGQSWYPPGFVHAAGRQARPRPARRDAAHLASRPEQRPGRSAELCDAGRAERDRAP